MNSILHSTMKPFLSRLIRINSSEKSPLIYAALLAVIPFIIPLLMPEYCLAAGNDALLAQARIELITTIASGDTAKVSDLLHAFPQLVHATSDYGAPMIHYVYITSAEMTRLFLEKGADPNISFNKFPLIFSNFSPAYLERAKMLLEYGANPNSVEEYTGGTILFVAINNGCSDFVKTLLDYGADPKFVYDGKTPSEHARAKGQDAIAGIIDDWIASGAKPSGAVKRIASNAGLQTAGTSEAAGTYERTTASPAGKTSATTAGSSEATVKVELNATVNKLALEELYKAIEALDAGKVGEILRTGVDPNASIGPESQSYPALFHLLMSGWYCFSGGPNDIQEKTDLQKLEEIWSPRLGIMKLLLNGAGEGSGTADPKLMVNFDGASRPLLFWAVHMAFGYPDIINLFLDCGASADFPPTEDLGSWWKSVLEVFVFSWKTYPVKEHLDEHREILERLVKSGADVNEASAAMQETHLHTLSSNFGPDSDPVLDTVSWHVVQVFAKSGANINATEKNSGNTPLHCAVDRKHLATVRALLENGADPNVRNKFGATPLYTISNSSANNDTMLPFYQALVEAGADVNATQKGLEDRTPLHQSCSHPMIFAYLLQKGGKCRFVYVNGKPSQPCESCKKAMTGAASVKIPKVEKKPVLPKESKKDQYELVLSRQKGAGEGDVALTDGLKPVHFTVDLTDYDGGAPAKKSAGKTNAHIRLIVDEKPLKGFKGIIDPPGVDLKIPGGTKFMYIPPELSPQNFSRGEVRIRAEAKISGKTVKSNEITLELNAGRMIHLNVRKKGYAAEKPIEIQFPGSEGKLTGKLIADCAGIIDPVPLAHAEVWVSMADDEKLKGGTRVETDDQGAFTAPFSVSGYSGVDFSVNEPFLIALDKDTRRWLDEGVKHSAALIQGGYNADGCLSFFQKFPRALAKSKPMDTYQTNSTDYLTSAMPVAAAACGYLVQCDEMHELDLERFREYLGKCVETIFEIIGLAKKTGDKIDAKTKELNKIVEEKGDKLKEKLDSLCGENSVSVKFSKKLRTRAIQIIFKFMVTVYKWVEASYKVIDNTLANAEALGIKSDEGENDFMHLNKIANHPWKKKADWVFKPIDTAADILKEQIAFIENFSAEYIKKTAEEWALGDYKGFINGLLKNIASRADSGKIFWSDPDRPLATSRQKFSDFAEKHRGMYVEIMDQELKKLNFEQCTHPILKGLEMWETWAVQLHMQTMNLTRALAEGDIENLKDIQDNFQISFDMADKAFEAISAVFSAMHANRLVNSMREVECQTVEIVNYLTKTMGKE